MGYTKQFSLLVPASPNAPEVIQTSQLHACTFQLLFTFILQGSAIGLFSLLVCEVKICLLFFVFCFFSGESIVHDLLFNI